MRCEKHGDERLPDMRGREDSPSSGADSRAHRLGLSEVRVRLGLLGRRVHQVQLEPDADVERERDVTSPKYYAGVGSRDTPPEVLARMTGIATKLYYLGYVLRSGGAPGADQAFEAGVDLRYDQRSEIAKCSRRAEEQGVDCGICPLPACPYVRKEIYLPWKGFNGRADGLIPIEWAAAIQMASIFHPNWAACSQGARKLHARNCFQVLGQDLETPAEFVACWTKGGKGGGGTGMAIRIARAKGILVYDLGDPKVKVPREWGNT